jgi:predicted ArsR family transcriptional regulator
MDADQLLASEEGPALGQGRGSRGDVLEMLRAGDQPLGVRDVAQRTGLHQNTARFHLEALVKSGLATRETQDRETPGRPRVGYRASTRATIGGRRRYRLLSEMLATLIGTMPEPGTSAEEAGREWGEYLTEQPPPYQRPTAEQAIAKLTSSLAELGFAPELADGGEDGRYAVNLRQCPFREVAQQHRQVVCGLHLGLMRGALSRMRAPVTADGLDSFVEPDLCVARLAVSELPVLRILGELGRVVTVPGTQFRRRRDVLRPFVQSRGVLAQSARPDPVDEHPGAVVGRWRVIDPAGPDV